MLKLEIAGCALLLVATLAILFSSPDTPWEERARLESQTNGEDSSTSTLERERERVPSRPPTPPKPRPPTLAVKGKLVVVGPDGAESTNRSGEIYLKLELDSDPAEVHRVEVKDGEFSIDAYLGAYLTCETATIDGEYAVADLPRTLANATEDLVIRARISQPLRVLVMDDTTGEAARYVVLRTTRGGHQLFPPSLDELSVIGRPGPSPREIASDLPPLDCWVDAAGYAFERIHVDPRKGGDIILRATRPATARIQLVGVPAPPNLILSLRPGEEGANDVELQRIDAGTTPIHLLERLRPQTLRVVASVPSESPRIRAEATLVLVANQITDCVLDLSP